MTYRKISVDLISKCKIRIPVDVGKQFAIKKRPPNGGPVKNRTLELRSSDKENSDQEMFGKLRKVPEFFGKITGVPE
jgi:hypothetical protein